MPSPRACRLLTPGCKVNQYETQYVKEMLEMLEHNDYVEAAEGQPADLCVVNTCTVTMEGDAKSRQAPMVPGPHTSWVMRISTSIQIFSSGTTASRPAWRARIFPVRVSEGMRSRSRKVEAWHNRHYRSEEEKLQEGTS